MSEKVRLPNCLLDGLIHAQMATGNFAKMAHDAAAWARSQRRDDDAKLYQNMLDQVGDYFSQSGK